MCSALGVSTVAREKSFNEAFPGRMQNRILKGLGAILSGQVISSIGRLAIVPIFLRAWGIDLYGEWQVLTAAVGYLALTDMGGQQFITNEMTEAFSKGDRSRFREILHSGLAVFLAIPIIIVGLFIMCLWLMGAESLLNRSHLSGGSIRWTMAILACTYIISLPQGIATGVYRAVGLLARGAMLGNVMTLITFLATAAGLLCGMGTVGLAWILLIPYVISFGWVVWDLESQFPGLFLPFISDVRPKLIRASIAPSLHFFAIQGAQILTLQGPILILGWFRGSRDVVLFTTLRTMINLIRQAAGTVMTPTWPELIRLYALGDRGRLRRLFRLLSRGASFLALSFALLLHWYGSALYSWWVGRRLEVEQGMLDLFLLYGVLQMLWLPGANVLMAINRHEQLARRQALGAVCSLVLGIFLVRGFGVEGAITSLAICDLMFLAFTVPQLACAVTRVSTTRELWRDFGLGVVFAAGGWIGQAFVPISLLLLTVWFGVSLHETRSQPD